MEPNEEKELSEEELLETLAVNCKTFGVSISAPSEYLIGEIRKHEFQTREVVLGRADIIRLCIDFYASKNCPQAFNDIQEFIKGV